MTKLTGLFYLVTVISFPVLLPGQIALPDNAGRKRLIDMSENLREEHEILKSEAMEWADRNLIQTRIKLPDGRVRELQYMDFDGVPVFYETRNSVAASTTTTSRLHPGGELRLFLTGRGITGGIWDAGIADAGHPELKGRIMPKDNSRNNFHATLVAGTMVSAGIVPAARGMAPEAELVSYAWTNDLGKMAAEAAEGLIVSNHSYGINLGWSRKDGVWVWNAHNDSTRDYRFGFYNNKSRVIDEIAYNAPNYLIVWAAGNDRNDTGDGTRPPDGPYKSIGPEAVAKNSLTVGAVSKISGGYFSLPDISMSHFSSWGPTNDGRIKPDIVGAGVQLFSTGPGESYSTVSGTSMAAPNVSGSLLLLQQLYRELYSTDSYLRSSTLRGLVIHTAFEAGEAGPDYRFGWGLLNTEKAARVILYRDDPGIEILELSLFEGEEFELVFESTGNGNIVATICWTDPPGKPPQPAMHPPDLMLVNDLDMRIYAEDGSEVFFPWRLSPDTPSERATRGDNFRDNVEKITIEDPSPGRYKLKVAHKGSLTGLKQDFSLILQAGNIPDRRTFYWIGSDGSWQNGANWSLDSGGEPAGIFPGRDDHVVFDGRSFNAGNTAGHVVRLDDDAECYTFNWLTDKMAELRSGSHRISIYGSIISSETNRLKADSLEIVFTGTLPGNTISFFGSTFRKSSFKFQGSGKWTIRNGLQVNSIDVQDGVLVAADINIIAREFVVREGKNVNIDLSNARIDSLSMFRLPEGFLNVDLSGSELRFSGNGQVSGESMLSAGNYSFWNLYNSGNTLTVRGSNSYNLISIDGPLHLEDDSKISDMVIYPGGGLILGSGSRQSITGSFRIMNSDGSVIPLVSDGEGNAIIEVLKHSRLCFNYLDVFGVTATGEAVFNAGLNSTVDYTSEGWLAELCEDVLFADFDYRYACADAYTRFRDLSSGKIEDWLWEFNINDKKLKSQLQESYVSFPDTGYYNVSLTIRDTDNLHAHTKNIHIRSNTLTPPQIMVTSNKYTTEASSPFYQWFRDGILIPDENGRTFINEGEIEGVYQVLVFDATCSIFSEPMVVTSSQEIPGNIEGNIDIYPNPAGEYLIIRGYFPSSSDLFLEIFDNRGRVVYQEIMIGGIAREKVIDVSSLASGIYFIRITDSYEIYNGKVFVNR
jgi:hypothetical protein